MANLAILGGEKAVKLDYETYGNVPIVSEAAIESVVELLKKGQISTAPVVGEFERKFADYIGTKYALSSVNGTSSLLTALFAIGVSPGDEVIVPSYTFWASVAPIVSAHAVPVFCDVDAQTYNLDPKEIEKKITPKTKAIMLVHVWGNPSDMDAIVEIAQKHNIKLIEDSAHAHGALWKGAKVGSIGDVACFSLQGSKTLPAGEGGILVTNNKEYYEKAVSLGHYERIDDLSADSAYKKYALTGMGYKFRAHPLGIAIANHGLDELDERNRIRKSNAKYLEEALLELPFIVPQKVYDGAERQYTYHYASFDETKLEGISMMTFLNALSKEGVICGACGYGRLHEAPLFTEGGPFGDCIPSNSLSDAGASGCPNTVLPVTSYLAAHTFMMAPRFEKPCKELLDQYIQAYMKIAGNIDELRQLEKSSSTKVDKEKMSGRSINIIK